MLSLAARLDIGAALTSQDHMHVFLLGRAGQSIPPEEVQSLTAMKIQELLCADQYILPRHFQPGRLRAAGDAAVGGTDPRANFPSIAFAIIEETDVFLV